MKLDTVAFLVHNLFSLSS